MIRRSPVPRTVPRGCEWPPRCSARALPDWHSDVHQLIAEGDIVVERFTASGTHTGELMGAQPTGKTITLAGIQIFRLQGDKIVERWGRLDEVGLLRQLGERCSMATTSTRRRLSSMR